MESIKKASENDGEIPSKRNFCLSLLPLSLETLVSRLCHFLVEQINILLARAWIYFMT